MNFSKITPSHSASEGLFSRASISSVKLVASQAGKAILVAFAMLSPLEAAEPLRQIPVTAKRWEAFSTPSAYAAASCANWNYSVRNLRVLDDGWVVQFECWSEGVHVANGGNVATGICPDDKGSGIFTTASGWTGYNAYCWATGGKNHGPPKCNGVGNPIHVGTGNKYQEEIDYEGPGHAPMRFVRYYNSADATKIGSSSAATPLWRHTYSRSVAIYSVPKKPRMALVLRPDGRHELFHDSARMKTWSSEGDEVNRLVETVDEHSVTTGFVFLNTSTGSKETFDKEGKLLSIWHRTGILEQLTYSETDSQLLLSVSNSLGRTISLEYRPDHMLRKMTDPAGGEYVYDYDEQLRLTSVIYPDLKSRQYLYNEPENVAASIPHALTGIVDENSVRFATWKYDASKRSYSSEHALGVDKVTLAFSGNDTTVTEGNRISVVSGGPSSVRWLNAGSTQPAGAGCSASARFSEYEPTNLNRIKSTDFNGGITTYAYDLARNLETSRTEAAGTAEARTISTQWHPDFRSPTLVAAPLLAVTTTYFPNGLVESETSQSTSDATGAQGFSAARVGTSRRTEYTYTAVGQLKTVKGPRTDVNDLKVYEYDGFGNLSSVRNAAGHVTTYSNYDLHGRPRKVVDRHGIGTEYTYNARGWLETHTLRGSAGSALITRYEYDGVGQLVSVQNPDQTVLTFIYDDARRLTSISDKRGNTVRYELDNKGNRIKEEVTDASGTLARRITRVYDALNRIEQVTGAAR